MFYTYDLSKYKDELRGFYIDVYNDLPGPLLYTSDEVIDRIKKILKRLCMNMKRNIRVSMKNFVHLMTAKLQKE